MQTAKVVPSQLQTQSVTQPFMKALPQMGTGASDPQPARSYRKALPTPQPASPDEGAASPGEGPASPGEGALGLEEHEAATVRHANAQSPRSRRTRTAYSA